LEPLRLRRLPVRQTSDICRDDLMRSDGAPLSGWRAKSIETFVKIAFA
jgi:hypothetical protein